jgi:hypothetical protein
VALNPLRHNEIQRRESEVKARVLTDITGSWWYCPGPDGKTGYESGAVRGQIVDLSKEQVRHEVSAGRVELKTDGPVGRAHDKGYIASQLAQLGK